MHTSKLKNIYNKTGANEDCKNYEKQKNFCVNLLRNTEKDYFQKLNISYLKYFLRNTKKDYFQNLNISYLTYNKKFWKIIKPFYRNKGLNSDILILREKDISTFDEKPLTTLRRKYFVNIITTD